MKIPYIKRIFSFSLFIIYCILRFTLIFLPSIKKGRAIIFEEDSRNEIERSGDGFFIKRVLKDFNFEGKDEKLLDIGCGQGSYTLASTSIGFLTIGLDPNKEILKIAKNRIKKSNYYVPLIIGKGENLPFKDKTFEKIIFYGGIFYGDVKKILNEIHRVLTENGKVALGILSYGYYILNAKKSLFLGDSKKFMFYFNAIMQYFIFRKFTLNVPNLITPARFKDIIRYENFELLKIRPQPLYRDGKKRFIFTVNYFATLQKK